MDLRRNVLELGLLFPSHFRPEHFIIYVVVSYNLYLEKLFRVEAQQIEHPTYQSGTLVTLWKSPSLRTISRL